MFFLRDEHPEALPGVLLIADGAHLLILIWLHLDYTYFLAANAKVVLGGSSSTVRCGTTPTLPSSPPRDRSRLSLPASSGATAGARSGSTCASETLLTFRGWCGTPGREGEVTPWRVWSPVDVGEFEDGMVDRTRFGGHRG